LSFEPRERRAAGLWLQENTAAREKKVTGYRLLAAGRYNHAYKVYLVFA
jgi:hypothetical protein